MAITQAMLWLSSLAWRRGHVFLENKTRSIESDACKESKEGSKEE